MVDLDKPYFSSELQHFAVVNRITVSNEMRLAYWEDLSPMSITDFKQASARLRRTAKWFPKPSEFWSARRLGWT